MNILLTGATGFLGTALSKRLLKDGHDLTAWVRKVSRSPSSDIACYTRLSEIPDSGFDAVINLAGAPITTSR